MGALRCRGIAGPTIGNDGETAPPLLMRVVVPAYRAHGMLPRCVDALACASRIVPFGIVVVDDGENGDLVRLLAPWQVRIVNEGHSGSAAIARNRGALGYDGDILVFVDADVLVEPQAIELLVAPIREGRADATVGRYSERVQGLGFAQRYKHFYLHRVHARRQGYLRNHFWTALCAIRSGAFTDVSGFSPRFAGACEEDNELGHRLTARGFRILAVPEATARNIKPYSVGSLIRNDLRKGIGAIRLLMASKTPITDNPHSSRTDILAVVLAAMLVLLPLTSFVAGWPIVASAALLLGAAYGGVRRELVGDFLGCGWWFAVRAILLMFLLDLVRAACVGVGASLVAFGRPHGTAPRPCVKEGASNVGSPGGGARPWIASVAKSDHGL